MDLSLRKMNIIEQLIKVQDESSIQRIEQALKVKYKKTTAAKLVAMSYEELQEKLDRSEQDVKDGRVYTTKEVREHFQNKA
jgi:DNA primase large subunit